MLSPVSPGTPTPPFPSTHPSPSYEKETELPLTLPPVQWFEAS